MANPSVTDGSTAAAARPEPRLLSLGDLLDEWQDDAQAAHGARVNGTARGPVTGLRSLDAALGGVLAPGVHILHAEPGIGKTALALQIAATCGVPALYLTAEMHCLELFKRITARETGTYLGRLKSGELTPEDSLDKARQAAAAVPHLTLADATAAFATLDWLTGAARVARGAAPHVLVIVDSVHSWAAGSPAALDEYVALNAALDTLRQLAGRLNAPCLGIAERNRASMREGGLSASAGSRRFEYGSESVLELAKEDPDKAGPLAAGETPVSLRLAKNRHGSAGTKLRLTFNGALQMFTDRGPVV